MYLSTSQKMVIFHAISLEIPLIHQDQLIDIFEKRGGDNVSIFRQTLGLCFEHRDVLTSFSGQKLIEHLICGKKQKGKFLFSLTLGSSRSKQNNIFLKKAQFSIPRLICAFDLSNCCSLRSSANINK